jgi:Tol biopolymer transport system component
VREDIPVTWNRYWLLLMACCSPACTTPEFPAAVSEGVIERPALSGQPMRVPTAPRTTAGPQSSPAASPSPSPSPSSSPSATLLPFSRGFEVAGTDERQLDIVLFNRTRAELLTLPSVNSRADEFFPSFSHKGRYLTFTTTISGNADVRRCDLRTHLVDTLPALNTSAQALRAVSSDDGHWIALSERVGDRTQMVLYDYRTKTRSLPAPTLRGWTDPLVRDISPDGRLVAFSALHNGQLDIAFYDLVAGEIITPPFVNGPFNDTSPSFSPDGSRLLFVSDRLGSLDVFLVDLASGWIDTLPMLNSPDAADVDPVFLPSGDEIVFQTNRTDPPNLFIYDMRTQLLDLAPVANPDDDPNFETIAAP